MLNDTQTLTPTGFVLARIAADEAEARHVSAVGSCEPAYRPARVLAQCEAHRRIIELAWDDLERIEGEWGSGRCREQMEAEGDVPDAVRALAAVYADHEGFRDEWLS